MDRLQLLRERRDAMSVAANGVMVLVSVPIVGAAASVLASYLPDGAAIATFVLAALYVVCGGAIGIGMITGSLARRYTTSARLAQLDRAAQLPAARVIVRQCSR